MGSTDRERSDTRRAEPIEVDPKLRGISQQILSLTVDARLRQLEAEANFFAQLRPVDGP